MNDRHEQSRAAFEDRYHRHALTRLNIQGVDFYSDPVIHGRWLEWCRALDYAAEQQTTKECAELRARANHWTDEERAKLDAEAQALFQQLAPTILTRPDRPGLWWKWTVDRWVHWEIDEWNGKLGAWSDDLLWHDPVEDGLWLPATPPPAPTVKEGMK